jgi:hypothetical protein
MMECFCLMCERLIDRSIGWEEGDGCFEVGED